MVSDLLWRSAKLRAGAPRRRSGDSSRASICSLIASKSSCTLIDRSDTPERLSVLAQHSPSKFVNQHAVVTSHVLLFSTSAPDDLLACWSGKSNV
eukprot:01603_6